MAPGSTSGTGSVPDLIIQQGIGMSSQVSGALPLLHAGSGCGVIAGGCTINPASGNLIAEIQMPAAGNFAPESRFTYNSLSIEASEYGFGWNGSYRRRLDPATAELTTDNGTVLDYTGSGVGSYTPPAGWDTALEKNGDNTWTETQVGGLEARYDTAGLLTRYQSATGGRWTLTYDTGNRVEWVTDVFDRRSTFAYNAVNKIQRYTDVGGRVTTFTVDGSGDLTQITTPELCVTNLRYDDVHRLTGWINPEGDRTTYVYDDSDRVSSVLAPGGGRTTYSYRTGVTAVIDPRGNRTTLVLENNERIKSWINPLGQRTRRTPGKTAGWRRFATPWATGRRSPIPR